MILEYKVYRVPYLALPPKIKNLRGYLPIMITLQKPGVTFRTPGIAIVYILLEDRGAWCFETPPPPKKMYQIRGCCTIDFHWYLGGGKLAFSKQSKNVASVAHHSTKQVRLQRLLEVTTPATPVAACCRWYTSSKPR